MISQIYVSRSLIDPAERGGVIDDILTVAITRNTMLGITGLLIASPDYFAQLLEGPEAGIAAVMASIVADPRHTACRVVRRVPIVEARCPQWRMARLDCGNFGHDVIDPLLMAAHAGTDDNAVCRLERLIATIAQDVALSQQSMMQS